MWSSALSCRIALFGPPGVGKTTQATTLSLFYGVPLLSVEAILQATSMKSTALGLEAARYAREGLLVPDGVILGLIEQRLHQPDCKSGFVLDGFPRTGAQALALDLVLEWVKQPLARAIVLVAPDDLLTQRCPLIERHHFIAYHRNVAPELRNHYARGDTLCTVDAAGSQDEVLRRIFAVITQGHQHA